MLVAASTIAIPAAGVSIWVIIFALLAVFIVALLSRQHGQSNEEGFR